MSAVALSRSMMELGRAVQQGRRGGARGGARQARDTVRALEGSPGARILRQLLEERAPELDAWGVSQAVWGLGWSGWSLKASAPLLRALESRAREELEDMTPQGLANVAWGMGRQAWRPDPAFTRALAQRARAGLASASAAGGAPPPRGEGPTPRAVFRPLEVTNLVEGLSRWRGAGTREALGAGGLPLADLEAYVEARLGEFRGMELVRLLDALRRLEAPISPRLLGGVSSELLLGEAADPGGSGGVPGLCRFVWLCGKLGFRPPDEHLQAAEAALGGCLEALKPVDLANFLWGAQQVGWRVDDALLRAMALRCEELLPRSNEKDITSVCWALGNDPRGEAHLRRVLSALVETPRVLRRFRPWSVCILLGACTRSDSLHEDAGDGGGDGGGGAPGGVWEPPVLAALEAQSMDGPVHLKARDVVEVMASFWRLGHQPGAPWLEEASRVVHDELPSMSAAAAARVLQLFAAFSWDGVGDGRWAGERGVFGGPGGRALAHMVESRLQREMAELSPYSLSTSLLGFVRTRHRPAGAFLEAANARAQDCLEAFSPSDFAMFMWASCRLGGLQAAGADLPGALAGHFCTLMPEMSTAQFCQSLWAMASGLSRGFEDAPDPLAFSKSEVFVRRRADSFAPIDICTVLHAYALAGWCPEPITFLELEAEVGAYCSAEPSDSQYVSSVAWAFAKLHQRPGPVLMEAFEAHWGDRAGLLSPQQLAQLVWCLSRWDYRPSELLLAVERELPRSLAHFGEQDLANLIWGFHHLRHPPAAEIGERLVQRALEVIDEFTLQGLLNFFVGASCLGIPLGEPAYAAFAEQVTARRGELQAQDLGDVLSVLGGRKELGAVMKVLTKLNLDPAEMADLVQFSSAQREAPPRAGGAARSPDWGGGEPPSGVAEPDRDGRGGLSAGAGAGFRAGEGASAAGPGGGAGR